jgi:hypothetical protein
MIVSIPDWLTFLKIFIIVQWPLTSKTINDKVEIFGDISEGDILLVRATNEIKPGVQLNPKM